MTKQLQVLSDRLQDYGLSMNLFYPVLNMHGPWDITTTSCFAELRNTLLRSAEASNVGTAGLKGLFYAEYFASFADILLSGLC